MSNDASASTGSAEPTWFKSSYSGGEGGECVEVAVSDQAVLIRDSKAVQGPRLTVGQADWTRFVRFAADS